MIFFPILLFSFLFFILKKSQILFMIEQLYKFLSSNSLSSSLLRGSCIWQIEVLEVWMIQANQAWMSYRGSAQRTFRLFIAPFHNATPTKNCKSNKIWDTTQNKLTCTDLHRARRNNTSRIHGHKVWPSDSDDYSDRACIC